VLKWKAFTIWNTLLPKREKPEVLEEEVGREYRSSRETERGSRQGVCDLGGGECWRGEVHLMKTKKFLSK